VIYYIDPVWDTAWGECQGTTGWLPIADSPTPLKAGQRVAIEGSILPAQERLIWDKTRVRVLEDKVELKAEPIRNLPDRAREIQGHRVSVEGLIDRQMEDSTHFNLTFLAGSTAATAHVLKDPTGTPPRFKEGDFVRMKCVYEPQFEPDGILGNLVLWIARPSDIEVIGSLRTDVRFAGPITLSENIPGDTPADKLLHIDGIVRSHEPGKWVTVWDATGQIMVKSRQTQPLRVGDRIEALGYPAILGVQQCLLDGMYRKSNATNKPVPASITPTGKSPLRLAEQIRELSHEDAARHLPVRLYAVVTWHHEQTPFAFVQDASSGIRVFNPQWETMEVSKPGTVVTVEGVTSEGDFVPVVTNAIIRKAGWWNLEEGKLVTLEQALTGVEDGRWVQMRGFVREVTNVNTLVHMDLSTSSGEFQVWTPASQSFKPLKGSIIRVQGVCAAVANARHQLTGVQIWSPEPKYIQVEEAAPDDLFAAPLRSPGSLRRFNLKNALNQRVRTSGTVVLQAPGRYLYVQDGVDSIFALSQQQDLLRPGDQVELVGFPGNVGRRFLLREAVYRRISPGAEPVPVQLSAVQSVNLELEGVLAEAEGVLLNAREKDGEGRLLIHAADSAFEVSLDSTAADVSRKLQALELGSRLAVTGVYEVQSDEYGNPRSFLLRLRSWNDIHYLQRPSWWTLARLLWVLSGVLIVSVFALSWGFLIAHKNRLLRQAQAQLQTANDKLEYRVQERTRELEEQVAAKERARAELAEAQENLVLTSRQAGMAEVATGVLHNVGNVLNSVNVSAGILSERLRRSSMESVAKAAALLHQQRDQLARFLTEDPKGKTLPDFMEKLGEVLIQDKRDMQGEIQSLTKNIDHIKIIVSMQQSYAKIGGVLEELDPKDLVEDAIQINSASLERDRIRLIRNYHAVPRVRVDRHKVLQILVNLVSNAKHALREKASDRELTLCISSLDPGLVSIIVNDNGAGIAPENLSRLFSQGFTTRKEGHGFGLHSGAIAAKELGGSLAVHSAGIGCGAAFTLELPAACQRRSENVVKTPI
jgi:signal transduction histidine kinase